MFKKLIDKFKKVKNRISIKTYKKPLIFIIGLMIFINVLILVVAAFIALRIDDSFNGFFDAFTNGSIKWLILPNSVLNITNPKLLLLAVFVLVVGMVLFSGIIIALTTNQIKSYIEKKQASSGRLNLEDHIVILNWNNKVPELVADLLYIEDKKISIVILANIDKTYAEKQIQNVISELDVSKKDIKDLLVLVKKGDPLLESDLKDVSIEHAKAVIIMNEDELNKLDSELKQSDLAVIKIILGLSKLKLSLDVPFIAEVKDYHTIGKVDILSSVVDSLKDRLLLPICFDRRLGQIIAQTIIDSKMEELYLSLFSFKDAEVYYIENESFENVLYNYPFVVPLAFDEGGVFALAEDDKDIEIKIKTKIKTKDLKIKNIKEDKKLNVYIIGKNNKLEFILDSFNEYKRIYQNDFTAEYISNDKVEELVENINVSDKESTILLLSDDKKEKECLDSNVIDTLIMIESKIDNKNVNTIVELLDPKNYSIISNFNIRNTIISNKIISLLLSKLALYPKTAQFYENLLTMTLGSGEKDDAQIFIKKAIDIIDFKEEIKFNSIKEFIVSFYYASNKERIPIGSVINGNIKLFYGDLMKQELKVDEKQDIIYINV